MCPRLLLLLQSDVVRARKSSLVLARASHKRDYCPAGERRRASYDDVVDCRRDSTDRLVTAARRQNARLSTSRTRSMNICAHGKRADVRAAAAVALACRCIDGTVWRRHSATATATCCRRVSCLFDSAGSLVRLTVVVFRRFAKTPIRLVLRIS